MKNFAGYGSMLAEVLLTKQAGSQRKGKILTSIRIHSMPPHWRFWCLLPYYHFQYITLSMRWTRLSHTSVESPPSSTINQKFFSWGAVFNMLDSFSTMFLYRLVGV